MNEDFLAILTKNITACAEKANKRRIQKDKDLRKMYPGDVDKLEQIVEQFLVPNPPKFESLWDEIFPKPTSQAGDGFSLEGE